MSDNVERPTLSIAIIARNCAADLERCLKSIRARPWGAEVQIVVVDTVSGDDGATVAVAKQFADVVDEYAGPNGTWTKEMLAFDDAAAARNRSFELASGAWVMWIDSDDQLLGPEETSRLLELNGRLRPGPFSHDKKFLGNDPAALRPMGLPDQLRALDAHPESQKVSGFWAPYLYRFVDNDFARGVAMTWQTRERIVRNNKSWRWVRPAHEVLVPNDPKMHAAMGTLTSLLIVHRKVWDEAAATYSLVRHKAILDRDYDAGVRNCQDILYLENYEWALHGSVARRRELIVAGLECAHTPIDRARVLSRQAALAKEQGYFHDAVASYAAAIEVEPGIADFYFALAKVYADADLYVKAVEWYERGISTPVAHPFSDVTPRSHLVEQRIHAALAAHEASKLALAGSNLSLAETYAEKAVNLSLAALKEPCIGPDKTEAIQWYGLFENERDALKVAKNIFNVWDYLKKNDETERAAELLKLVPHNLKDHPIVIEIEKWAAQLKKHMADPAAYAEFYEAIGTDITSNADADVEPLPRCTFAAEQLLTERERLGRPLRILEVGPFDGITFIPLMKALPDCHFVGLEIKKDAANRLRARLEKRGFGDRSTILHGQLSDADRLLDEEDGGGGRNFDAIIFFEVIEHVSDVDKAISLLGNLLRSGGQLYVSTPWGAFDRGHQPMAETRDNRGHVRAMTADELVSAVERNTAGFIVEQQSGCHTEGNYGDTLHLVARKLGPHMRADRQELNFFVPSALWPWNAETLIRTGMGASEETIVYLARELAQEDDGLKARVFGPLPKVFSLAEEEVNSRVQYSVREALRHANPSAPFIVSRAPSALKIVEQNYGLKFKRPILWLQDATYPDLEERWKDYSEIVVLSQWHKQTLHEVCKVPLERMTVIPNFLLTEHFDVARVLTANADRAKALKEGQLRCVYASSPDRGLIELLSVWKHVIKEWPKSELRIFYGWEGCMKLAGNDAGWNKRYRELRETYLELKDQPGVIEHGRVNHHEIANWMRWAHVFPYVTNFSETWCSSAMKARAAGCVPVVSPVAALNESAKCAQTIYTDHLRPNEGFGDFMWRYFTAIKQAVGTDDAARLLMAKEAIDAYRVESIAPLWTKLLRG